jgi:hypothetical protein
MRREKEIRRLEEEEEKRDETKQCKKSRGDPPLFYSTVCIVGYFSKEPAQTKNLPNINPFL